MSELQDLAALVRSNTALIVIETPDEGRVVDLFRYVLMDVWRALYRWSITEGLRRVDIDGDQATAHAPDAGNTLRTIKAAEQRGIYLLFAFHPYLRYATTARLLRDIVHRRECQPHTLVLDGARLEYTGRPHVSTPT